jgi:hypothetical protein
MIVLPTTRTMRGVVAATFLVAVLAACDGGPADPTDPGDSTGEPGLLNVHTSATGRWMPEGGAQIIIDDDPETVQAIDLNGTLDVSLPPGDHTVELFRGGGQRFYPACEVEGGRRREVSIGPGGSAGADFSMLCEVALELRISTTGSSPDPDGYRLVVGPDYVRDPDILFPVYDVAPNDTLVFDLESPTWWTEQWADQSELPTFIYLWGEDPNCTLSESLPIRVDPGGGLLTLDLTVDCVEPPALDGTIYLDRGGDLVALEADGSGTTVLISGWESNDWTLSPDGSQVFFTRWYDGPFFIGDLGTGGVTEMLPDVAFAGQHPHWGADGWVYYDQYSEEGGRQEVYRIRPSDGERQQVTNDGGEQPELSPDGTTLLYLRSSGLTLSDPDGANPRALGVPHFVHNPEWSPDGSLIAAHLFGPEWWRDHRLTTIDPMTGETTTLTSRPYHDWDGFAWSPDGTKLVYPAVQTTDEWWWDWDHDGDLYVVSVDGRNLGRLTPPSGDMRFADPVWRD